MNVRIIVGANAYAMIRHGQGSCDILLNPGRSAPRSLRETAAEWREEAKRLMARAAIAEQAAYILAESAKIGEASK